MLLRHALRRAVRRRLGLLDVIVCAPLGVTAVERRAVQEAARGAGAHGAFVMEEPLAAAIGSGLPVAEPTGSMVVDIGGGTSEIAVVSLGGIVSAESVRIGGRHLDVAIQAHMQRRHKVAIGLTTAEELKIEIGSARPEPGRHAELRGRSLLSGLPCTVVVGGEEVAEAIDEPLSRIIGAIRRSLERTPPELAADVMDAGVMLTGGGALLTGLPDRLRAELGIPIHVADEPLGAVARGAGMALEEMRAIRRAEQESFTGR
jgi:rod shape-determining protein MreB